MRRSLFVYLVLFCQVSEQTAENKCQSKEWESREDDGFNEASFMKNLRIDSYNFRTILYWDVDSRKTVNSSSVPYFTVVLRKYKTDTCALVQKCIQIVHQYCDITEMLQDVDDFYWTKVKAYMASKEFELMTGFSYKDPGIIIGPPKMNITVDGESVTVLLQHPLTPFEDRYTVRMIYTDFYYYLLSSCSLPKIIKNCTLQYCIMYRFVPVLPFNCCISTQGISDRWGVKGTISNETCVSIKQKANLGSRYVSRIIKTILFSIVSVIVLVVVTLKLLGLLKKKNEDFPKSLGNIVRSWHPYPASEECTENHLLIVPPSERIVKVPEDHQLVCEEDKQQSHKEITISSESNHLPNENVKAEETAEAENLVENSDMSGGAYGLESLSEPKDDSSFRPFIYKSTVKTCRNDRPLPVTDTVRPVACITSSGYDCPQVLDVLIDHNNGDCITGYK